MTRFALFAWDSYDAGGGVTDFVRFGTMEELRAEAEQLLVSKKREIVQIAEAETLRAICYADLHYKPSPLTGHPPIVSVRWENTTKG